MACHEIHDMLLQYCITCLSASGIRDSINTSSGRPGPNFPQTVPAWRPPL